MTEDKKKAAPPRPAAPSAPKIAPPRPAPPVPRTSERQAVAAAVVDDEVELIDDPSIAPPPIQLAPQSSVAPTARTSGAVAAALPVSGSARVVSAPPPIVISAPPPVVISAPPASPPLPPVAVEPTLPVVAAVLDNKPAPPTADESDSRSSRRFPFEINIDIVSEHNFYAGLSLNISEGGLFVATHVEYPIGARLEIRLLLPGDEDPTSILTEVRWVRPHNENADGSAGMGLKFLNVAPDILAKIHRFAENRDPLYYEDD